MSGSYSLASPNVCTTGPIERVVCATENLEIMQFPDRLGRHVSSAHQRYLADVITRHQIGNEYF
jgi:hypothetical protein